MYRLVNTGKYKTILLYRNQLLWKVDVVVYLSVLLKLFLEGKNVKIEKCFIISHEWLVYYDDVGYITFT